MTKTQFVEKLGAEIGVAPGKLGDTALLKSFSGWDSMGQMAVIAMIDTELEVQLPAGSLQNCNTVGDITALVAGKFHP